MGGSQCELMGVPPHLRVGAPYPGSLLPVRHSLHVPESSSLANSCHHQAPGLQLFMGSSGDLSPAWRRVGCDSGAMAA